ALATDQNVFRCYQCGCCTAGCPTAGRGDLLPHQVMRHLQLDSDAPLRAVQPWLCVGCQTCAERCPQELDLSRVMDALRAEAERAGTVPAAARRAYLFNRIFVDQVLAGGRLSEVMLGAEYNLRARAFLQNLENLPALLSRGKIRLDGKTLRGPGRARRGQAQPEKGQP
ncbi:MAG: 4Fe-4S dicluster domain-containing protein, partial [bacterium]|nr:4Fe-4S dicluster domain-containing protein [bacterium]